VAALTAEVPMSCDKFRARIRTMSVSVPLPMGRQDIGDFLGLSIATVSRTLNRLARERLILIAPRGVRILDLPRLQRLAGVEPASSI
jgi:CRP/FNR family transcriptional regulator